MRTVAVFDFDGTLTRKDTLIEFILFAKGRVKGLFGLLLFSPMIALMFMRLFDNNRCKEILLSWFFKGWKAEDFAAKGEAFKEKVRGILREDTVSTLKQHLAQGDEVYVISASIEDWVRPICVELGVKEENVLCTRMAISPLFRSAPELAKKGELEGTFLGHNCYGAQKVVRLKEAEPDRESYNLIAYGDSKGDKQMFDYADEWHLV